MSTKNYFLKFEIIIKIIERRILRIMEVVIGAKKVKPFLLMRISPGSLPRKGVLSTNMRRVPMMTKTTPKKIIALPNSWNIGILYQNEL